MPGSRMKIKENSGKIRRSKQQSPPLKRIWKEKGAVTDPPVRDEDLLVRVMLEGRDVGEEYAGIAGKSRSTSHEKIWLKESNRRK